jgi:D-threo-aldose 1-dehydrogenase
VGLGGAPLGNLYSAIDDDTARETVDAAWQSGVRYFDTAPHYGLGLSERRLGAALGSHPREEYVISTKVGRLLEPNPAPVGSDTEGFDVPDSHIRKRDYSRDGVLCSIEASLARLGLDRIDVVLVHDPENHLDQAIRETVPALAALRDQGVIGAVGVGMNLVEPLRRFVADSDVNIVMVAGRWTLLDRTAAPLLADCQVRGVSVLAAAPYNSGLLAKPVIAEDATFDYAAAPGEVIAVARRLAEICADHGVRLPAAAMQFPLLDPVVASVVVGARSAAEAEGTVAAATTPIPAQLWAALDDVAMPASR